MRNAQWLLVLRRLTLRLYGKRGISWIGEVVRRLFGRWHYVICVDGFDRDLSIEVDLSDHIGSQIFFHGAHSRDELAVLDRVFRPTDVFLDIGANIGEFTLFAARRLTEGHVHAFEPNGSLFHALGRNVSRNEFTNVQLHQLALSDVEGEAALFAPLHLFSDGTENRGLGSMFQRTGDQLVERVAVTTVDAFVSRAKLPCVDVIKMDIEGAELPALRGAIDTLHRMGPSLLIEINRLAAERAGYAAADILTLLRGLGYEFASVTRAGGLLPIDAPRLQDFQNVWCVRRGRR